MGIRRGLCGAMSIGVVLTGMGSDGARGSKAIKNAGGYVLARMKPRSVIFGMPAEAIKSGAVDHVLSIDDIYTSIENRVLGLSRLSQRECADAVASTHKAPHARTEQNHIVPLQHAGVAIFIGIGAGSAQRGHFGGVAMEIDEPTLPKVRHMFRRGEQNLYVVNGAVHFDCAFARFADLLLRRSRTALLIDGIEKMTTMTRLQALPAAFCHEERVWYRGLTVLDQNVIPAVSPEGF